MKGKFNKGQQADLYFWRDSKGMEVDLVLDDGSSLKPVEIKSGQTVAPDYFYFVILFRRRIWQPFNPP